MGQTFCDNDILQMVGEGGGNFEDKSFIYPVTLTYIARKR